MKVKKGQTVWIKYLDKSWKTAFVQTPMVNGQRGMIRLKVFTDMGAVDVIERKNSPYLSLTDPALEN